MLSDEQLLRYNRHILLPNVDIDGQLALADSRVLIIGLGGLGCPAAQYLAGAGVGQLILCDGDSVELSNLQRQLLYTEAQLGWPKPQAAAASLRALNSDIDIVEIAMPADVSLLSQWLPSVSVVLDCSDNIACRYMVNSACRAAGVPLVSAAAIGWSGQCISFDFKASSRPCYRCVYPDIDDQDLSCNDSGIMAPVVGLMGLSQALAAIKILLGMAVAAPILQCFDGLSGQWQDFAVPPLADCPACSNGQDEG